VNAATAADSNGSAYQPADRLYLWSLLESARPVAVGELNLVRSNQGVSLRYFADWLEQGFELSEDLPLVNQEFLPAERNTAVGAVDDARPDRWGERVIRFNILIDNTDDHEKNHALIMTERGQYELAPAFDVLPSGQALGFQQMRVGEQAADSTVANALSMSALFALKADEAAGEARAVAQVVSGWKEHFAACGVAHVDVELYAEQIDRPFLREQREELMAEHRRP